MNSFDNIDREYAYDGELGAVWSPEATRFAVWSPETEGAELRLYHDDSEPEPFRTEEMHCENGVWKAEVSGDLSGVYYTYAFTRNGNTAETIDIYARSAGVNGRRGMVLDLRTTDPEGWERDRQVALGDYTDAVIYELHVRDFSSDESGKFTLRGKFGAFCEKAVYGFGETIGLDYIKKLGVTHIHLLPVFDYQSVDESDPDAGFNWGYDPLNYNIPEGSYSTDPHHGEVRVRESKQLIQAAHERGIGIIMDVVYNHTYATEDSPFNKTYPGYYYRHNADGSLSNGSACGNEFASERAMAGRFIADSLLYWAREYHIDGFRFDLMGLLDIAALNRAAAELRAENPSVILYGEGWTGGSCPLPEELRAMKKNARELPDFAMFSDDLRDGVKGSVFYDDDCGYVNGKAAEHAELIKSVMSGGIPPQKLPLIFNNFERIGAVGDGVGLGLPITKNIAEIMGGAITAKSSPGAGSTFTLKIPQDIADASPIGEFTPELPVRPHVSASHFICPETEILAVDDNRYNRVVIEKLLRRTKAGVTTAESGEEMLRIARERRFDLIMLDAMMPGMSGVEALRKLRSDPASLCRETPVAVLTADAVVGARERYMSEGFDEYLSKPIISEELEQLLSRLVPGRIVTDSLPSAQKSGEPGSSLLNTAKGLEYSDNDPDFYRELLRLFTEEAPKSLERLSSALADNDLELYTTLVHGLKNNARGIGADSAGELCFEAEQTARAGNAAPLPELHSKIEQAITEAAAEAARLSETEKITQ